MSFVVVHGYSDKQVEKFETFSEMVEFLLYSDTCSHSSELVIAQEITIPDFKPTETDIGDLKYILSAFGLSFDRKERTDNED